MAFILIRSPSRAPPVLRREGSTEITAMVVLGSSSRNLRISSSVREDLPEPPVPVMPTTGALVLTWAVRAATTILQGRVVGLLVLLGPGDHPGQSQPLVRAKLPGAHRRTAVGAFHIHGLNHGVDHALQAHGPAVVRREYLGHAVGLQLVYLLGDDHSAASAVDLDVPGPLFLEQVDHVLEELDVPALVGGDRNAGGVFINGRVHDLGHGTVVAQVDHLGAGALEDAAHDVDGRVVTVKERSGGYEPDRLMGLVGCGFGVHGCPPFFVCGLPSRKCGSRDGS